MNLKRSHFSEFIGPGVKLVDILPLLFKGFQLSYLLPGKYTYTQVYGRILFDTYICSGNFYTYLIKSKLSKSYSSLTNN